MVMLNQVSERISGWHQPSRTKGAAALLILNGFAAGARDVARKPRATHVIATRDALSLTTQRQLGPGLGAAFGTASIAEASDSIFGAGVAINLTADRRSTRPTRVFQARETLVTPICRQLIGLGGQTGIAAIAEAHDVAAGTGTVSLVSADILSGQDTVGWPDPPFVWAPVRTASQTTLIKYITGSAAIAEGSDAVAGTGTLTWIGTAAITEAPDVAAGVGTLATTGTAAIAERGDVVAGTGVVGGIGVAAIAESADIVSATGTVGGVGVAAIHEAADVVVGVGTMTLLQGVGAVIESPDIVVGVGAGMASITEGPDSVVGVGISQPIGKRFGDSTISVAPSAQIIEESACFVFVNFVDSDGNAFLPQSAQYRLDDIASAHQILGWTPLPITGSTVMITVNSTQNELVGRISETHQCLVQFVDGLGNVDNIRATWQVCQVVGLPN